MLYKAIVSKKEHRKAWQGKDNSKNFDSSCRNHGGCLYCYGNRTHKTKKILLTTQEKLSEFYSE